MNNAALETIAKDLKIDKLKNSLSPKEYRIYVIYSATALWAKVATQDSSENISAGSRRHVIRVCSKFLEQALADESNEIKSYFINSENNSQKSPAIKIVDSLIRTGEINETGSNPDQLFLSLPYDSVIQLTPNYQINLGFLGTEDATGYRNYEIMSGLSFINKGTDGNNPLTINNSEWVENKIKLLNKTKPTRTKSFEEDRYFDINQYGKNKFSLKHPHEDYPFEIVMNQTIADNQYYIKTENGFYLIDNASVEIKDHQRFMIYLTSYFHKKIIKLKENGGVVRLDMYLSLPLLEDTCLRRSFWPLRSIDDTASFVGPLFLKSFILNILTNLGLEI